MFIMLKALKKKTGIVVVFFLVLNFASAQFYKDMSIGMNGGAYIYQGDLTPERLGAFKTAAPGINVFAKKPLNRFLAARINISLARLKADERKYKQPNWRQQRNFSFATPVKEFSALIVWDIMGKNYDNSGIMPYVFTGAGISFLNIKPDYSRLNTTVFAEGSTVQNGLAADIAHGTPKKISAIPVGLGIEKSISNRFSVNLETSYRFIFTDYLDGFSQAANPGKADHYHSSNVGVIYKFGKKNNGMGCPVMKY
jgi:Domain of unknown function (DUF6089)